MKKINLNCDVGEGLNNEEKLMPYIQSCNIACGGHAGDRNTMDHVVKLAIRHQVNIGAHPSYPDRQNFGRKTMKMSDDNLINEIRDQVARLRMIVIENKGHLNHIKPHGALYNDIAKSKKLTKLFLSAVSNLKSEIQLYLPFNSTASKLAKQMGFEVVNEVFADRNYNDDFSLVSRSQNNALLKEPMGVLNHVERMVEHQVIQTISKSQLHVDGETFCVHSDTENSVDIVKLLHHKFNL